MGGWSAGMTNARFTIHAIEALFGLLGRDSRQVDTDTASEIASGAKSRAPDDSGRLVNGITTSSDSPMVSVEAHAISTDGKHEDYARFVEKGHGSGVADDDFFQGDGGSALHGHRGGRAQPHPFFYPAIEDPLRQRWQRIEAIVDGYYQRIVGESGS